MKAIINSLLALAPIVFAVVFSVGVKAIDADMAAGSHGYLQAKIEYCQFCHGGSGQGYVGFLAMPRLAGQTTTYLESQLRAFAEGRRDRGLFLNMAKVHGLPRARGARRGTEPAPGGSAISLPDEPPVALSQRIQARGRGCRPDGYDGTDRAQSDPLADGRSRGIREPTQVTSQDRATELAP